MEDFFKYVECAVTVCDTECVIVYQNEKSVAVNGDMRGKCMLGCHNDRSRGIIARILSEGATNSYTISKKGQRHRGTKRPVTPPMMHRTATPAGQ